MNVNLDYELELAGDSESGFSVRVKSKTWEIGDQVFQITNVFGGEDVTGLPLEPSASLLGADLEGEQSKAEQVRRGAE